MNFRGISKVSISLATVTAAALLAPAAASAEPSARDIVKKSQQMIKLDASESLATLKNISKSGKERVRRFATVSKLYDNGDTEKRLMRFTDPAEVKGTGFLTYDYDAKSDDLWIYMPAMRKTRRIVSSEKSGSFMGSQFSYADITPPSVDDFNHKVVGSENVGGVDCWKIETTPKNADVAKENDFDKRVSYYGKADYMIRKSLSFDKAGTLKKELLARNIKEIDTQKHRYRPMEMEIINKLNGKRSIMLMEKIQMSTGIKDEYFTTRYLERQ